MGTNYYSIVKESEECPHCNHSTPRTEKHIGKSSFGWCFQLHVYPEESINSLNDWLPYFDKYIIEDEYGKTVSKEDILRIITEPKRSNNRNNSSSQIGSSLIRSQFLDHYQAVEGPYNLLRSRIDNTHCIGHGEGTYDYIVGEFS